MNAHVRFIHEGEKPFPCPSCSRKFSNKCHMKLHLRTHTKEKPHECDKCGKTFSRAEHLRYHLKTHTRIEIFGCALCESSFNNSVLLRKHAKSHVENNSKDENSRKVKADSKAPTTPNSAEEFLSQNNKSEISVVASDLHSTATISTNPVRKCDTLPIATANSSNKYNFAPTNSILESNSTTQAHVGNVSTLACEGSNSLTFPEIGEFRKLFSKSSLYEEGTALVPNQSDSLLHIPFTPIAGVKFASNDMVITSVNTSVTVPILNDVIVTNVMATNQPTGVPEFGQSSLLDNRPALISLNGHFGNSSIFCPMTNNSLPVLLPVCSTPVSDSPTFSSFNPVVIGSAELNESSNKWPGAPQADICDENVCKILSSINQSEFIDHTITTTTNMINKASTAATTLLTSVATTSITTTAAHTAATTLAEAINSTAASTTTVEPITRVGRHSLYRCTECDKRFSSSQHLLNHTRVHSGERPYECPQCNSRFTQVSSLKFHTSSVHAKERKHQCSVCSKTFARKSHLTRHALLHSGQKPYRCIICDHYFIERSKLRIHLSAHNLDEETLNKLLNQSTNDVAAATITTTSTAAATHAAIALTATATAATTTAVAHPEFTKGTLHIESSDSSSDVNGNKLANSFRDKNIPRHIDSPSKMVGSQGWGEKDDGINCYLKSLPDLEIPLNSGSQARHLTDSRIVQTTKPSIRQSNNKNNIKSGPRRTRKSTNQKMNKDEEKDTTNKQQSKNRKPKSNKISHNNSVVIGDSNGIAPCDPGVTGGCKMMTRSKSQSLRHSGRNRDNRPGASGVRSEPHSTRASSNVKLLKQQGGNADLNTKSVLGHFENSKELPVTKRDGENGSESNKRDRDGNALTTNQTKAGQENVKRPKKCNLVTMDMTSTIGDHGYKEATSKMLRKTCQSTKPTNYNATSYRRPTNHGKRRGFKCEQCGKLFNCLAVLRAHSVVHTGLKPYECDICKKHFTQKSSLKAHVAVIHGHSKKHQCSECTKNFSQKSHLKRHLIVHTGLKPHVCPGCNRMFTEHNKLLLHEKIHKKEEEKRKSKEKIDLHLDDEHLTCKICSKKFLKRSYLVKHEKLHGKINTYQCDRCSKQYRQKSSLEVHMRQHTGERPFVCDCCMKRFTSNTCLNAHKETHIRIQERHHSCLYCSLRFCKITLLAAHLRKAHDGRGLEEMTKERRELQASLRMVALTRDPQPWQCPDCPKRFTHKSLLEIHRRVHSREKPFICPLCQHSFTQKGSLKSHLRFVHNGERPHSCYFCESAFVSKKLLEKHIDSEHRNEESDTIKQVDKTDWATSVDSYDVQCLATRHDEDDVKSLTCESPPVIVSKTVIATHSPSFLHSFSSSCDPVATTSTSVETTSSLASISIPPTPFYSSLTRPVGGDSMSFGRPHDNINGKTFQQFIANSLAPIQLLNPFNAFLVPACGDFHPLSQLTQTGVATLQWLPSYAIDTPFLNTGTTVISNFPPSSSTKL